MRLKNAQSLQDYIKQLQHDLDILNYYYNQFHIECNYSSDFPKNQHDTYKNHVNIIQMHQRIVRNVKLMKEGK